MKNMIADGYQDARTLERRIKAVGGLAGQPELLEADADAEYAAVIEINPTSTQGAGRLLPERPGRRQVLLSRGGRREDRRRCSSARA